jgi:hypothetical protein
MPSDEMELDPSERDEYVPAVYARSEQEAEALRQLLEDHDIEAVIGYDELDDRGEPDAVAGVMSGGVPILVPEIYLDEASEIIADREDVDEYEPEIEEEQDEEADETLEGFEEAEPEELFLPDEEEEEEDLFADDEEDEFEDEFEDEDLDDEEYL